MNWINISMVWLVTLEVGFLADWCLRMILREDVKNCLELDEIICAKILFYSVAVGLWIALFLERWGFWGQLSCGVLAAYLLVASLQDHQSCEVYDFLHILALPAGLVFVLCEFSEDKLVSLLFFTVIQFVLFVRMYGFGDGLVYVVCAVFESRFGGGLLTYLLHMAASFGLLAVVQGCRRNINRKGNLKKPVPFVPYIAVTVWFFL